MLQSRINAAEEERAEKESMLLEVQKELAEMKESLNECEVQNSDELGQLNKLLLSERGTFEKQMDEVKAQYADILKI